MYLIGKPPISFGLQIFSHLTHGILLASDPHRQKKFLCILISLLLTLFGTLEKERKYNDWEVITDFMRQARPGIDISLPFQLDSLLLTLSTMGCQNWLFLGFPPIGIPRYRNGIFMCLQFRILENSFNNITPKPNPPILVLKKFTLSLDTSSKHLNITFIAHTFWTLASHMKRVSFANYSSPTLVPLKPTSTPQYNILLTVCLTNPDKPSTTIRNKNGSIRSPYLSSLVGTNSFVGLPLTNTTTDDDSMHSLIHPTHLAQNLNQYII